jgi:hypothetical protein
LGALAVEPEDHGQGTSGLAFAKQSKSHALEDGLLFLAHNVSEDEPGNLRSAALSIWVSSQIERPGLEPNITSTTARGWIRHEPMAERHHESAWRIRETTPTKSVVA